MMQNYDRDNAIRPGADTKARSYDEGLRRFMGSVYNRMMTGMFITAALAYIASGIPAVMNVIMTTPLGFVLALAPLGFVFLGMRPSLIQRKSPTYVKTIFYSLAAVMGLSFASIFLMFTGTSIARVFLITAAMFAGTSLYGYTTKKDLTSMGGFMAMGVIGLLVAMIVNLFLASTTLDLTISVLGVLIFTALTAYETQNLKQSYHASADQDMQSKIATMGAFSLYWNFILIFQFLLNLLGQRE